MTVPVIDGRASYNSKSTGPLDHHQARFSIYFLYSVKWVSNLLDSDGLSDFAETTVKNFVQAHDILLEKLLRISRLSDGAEAKSAVSPIVLI